MAIRSISKTDTLETFRIEFNNLAKDDFGDIATLSGAISATNLVDAMNETISIATSTAGWTIADDTSSTQLIGGGDTLTVLGTANQIQTVVSSPDTVTFSFPSTVSIQNLNTTGDISTIGTIEFNGSDIRSIDSTGIVINDTLRAQKLETGTGLLSIDESGGGGTAKISTTLASNIITFDATPIFNQSIVFEGSSVDDNETVLTVTNPTADRVLTLPDITGTLITTGDTGTVTGTMLSSTAVSASNITDDSITGAKLKDSTTLLIKNSSGTTLKTIIGAGS
tara:strand:+ start:6228 stop:7070 length:843 start_codon:yes stop_codon:yes gene_type:complete